MSESEEIRIICLLKVLIRPSPNAMNRIVFSDEGINSKFTFQILSTDDWHSKRSLQTLEAVARMLQMSSKMNALKENSWKKTASFMFGRLLICLSLKLTNIVKLDIL